MKATTTKFQIVTLNSWKVVARGFNSWNEAYHWGLNHDYGQFEDEGGWAVRPYTA